jgi:nardilysin
VCIVWKVNSRIGFLGLLQLLKLWHLQDRTFKRPIAEFRVQLHCAEANKTPLHSACGDLLVHLVCDALTETAYLASVCELGSSLSTNDGGFYMRVHGFDDKLLDLFDTLFEVFMQFRGRSDGSLPESIRSERFDLCLETYRRQCSNGGMKAAALATNLRINCLRPTSWSWQQKVNCHSQPVVCLYCCSAPHSNLLLQSWTI